MHGPRISPPLKCAVLRPFATQASWLLLTTSTAHALVLVKCGITFTLYKDWDKLTTVFTFAREMFTMVEDGSRRVSVEYLITLDDGTIVESNVGKEPLVFQRGKGMFPPGLERELVGLGVSESGQIRIAPEDAFGAIDPNAFVEVEPAVVPEPVREEGQVLVTNDPVGNEIHVRVHKVNSDKIVLDFNHPLAGQSLNFQVKVLAVD